VSKVKLVDAVLCGNCEEVYDRKKTRVCPECASPHFTVLELMFQNRAEDVMDVMELLKKITRLND
jgi:hypothetical protein